MIKAQPRKQRGVALITAVLIVALVTAAAVAMASKQQFDIRRTANIFNNDIAYQFALGAEDYARNVLEWDITKDGSTTDHLGENWAQDVAVPVEEAMLTGSMQDMQGRINLNALVKADGAANALMLKRFENLLQLLDLDQGIARAVLDWIDADINPGFIGGAEDDYYMLQIPPYRAANRLMASVSELLLVKGIDYESYQLLQPHVSALPDINSKINVNTASAEVLAALANTLTVADGEALIETRSDNGFAKIEDFTHALEQLGEHNYDPAFLDVSSDYFLISAMAEFDQSIARLYSLVHRNKTGGVRVVMRSRGAY
ncbi:MAG TPA: general secretion pathway protein GspK [Candidatus Tenderia electrophaga]|uniref:Type II secretion system protein K n=1 Tax=Candidatus Tenderia electrophaga TaxID=1748243 RepID=A0A832N6L1_9GAMM|nr:general secretion pathway protein GspK [Candidatus Tenderia electrophaga]